MVPQRRSTLLSKLPPLIGWVSMLLLLASTSLCYAARPGAPYISIPIEPLGYLPLPARIMISSAVSTLHFVDAQHLLFTFNNRSLLPRLPDADPDDEDRNVTALLLELPSGRVIARTEWRTRDHNQYLWPLGQGRFLLRVRARLTILDPMAELASGEAFRQQPFVDLKRRIGYISVSPGGDLVAIETVPPPKQPLRGAAASAAALAGTVPGAERAKEVAPEKQDRAPVAIHFYRVSTDSTEGHPPHIIAHSSGIVHAPVLIEVPATAEGFLDVAKESAGVYLFDFQSHAGKRIELSPYDTSCAPHPFFVSRSEFVALGCRGSRDREELSGFNLLGEENWIEVVSGRHISLSFATAPAAGRFAMSRIAIANSLIDPENVVPEELSGQEVRVLQSHDGRVLLKVATDPIQRFGQNFDLSTDGRALTVLRGGNIEVYGLPPLTDKDEKELARSNAAIPAGNDAVIRLNGVPIDTEKEAAATASEKPAQKPMAPSAASPQTSQNAPAALPEASPAEPEEHRKAPSLYGPDHPELPK